MTDATQPAADGDILEVVSTRFRWTGGGGFTYDPGSQRSHGLNRTREGARIRIGSHRTRLDARRQAFLATLFDDDTLRMMTTNQVTYEDGHHVVTGSMFEIRPAEIGA